MIIFKEIKLRYDYLDIILDEKLKDIRFANTVNVVVDLKEILRKVFRPDILDERDINSETIEELSSDIIGIVSHYRNYFYKQGKYSSFFFLYSSTECKVMIAKFPDYKKEYYRKYFNDPARLKKIDLVKKAVMISEKILNKVPNCQFIDTSQFDEFVVAKFLVNKIPTNEMTFILSSDEIMAQLINKHTFLIDMKSDDSTLLIEENAVKTLYKRETPISSKLISLVSAIMGTKRYSLNELPRVGPFRSIKAVERLLDEHKLINTEYLTFPVVKEVLDTKNTYEKLLYDNFNSIKENFEMIRSDDVLYSNNANITVLFNKPKQTFSTNYFLELDAKVFTNFPIHIDMLLKGEL